MKILHQETTIDKSTWPRGSWDNEPDKIHFVDEATDMDCLIVRVQHSGHLCGYVAIEPGHPAHKANYNRVQVEVHGGLTYGAMCDEQGHICHIPREGKPHDVFWLGFDHAHSGDLRPAQSDQIFRGGVYRDLDYVLSECASLAQQLVERQPLREEYDWEKES